MIICNKCQAEIPDDSRNCPYCKVLIVKDTQDDDIDIDWKTKKTTNDVKLSQDETKLNSLLKEGKVSEAKSTIIKGRLFNISIKVWNKDQLRMILEYEEARDALAVNPNNACRLTLDVSAITDMSGLFVGIEGGGVLDLSDWNVSKVENMSLMFYGTDISFVGWENWDVKNVRNMKWMMKGDKNKEKSEIVNCWKDKLHKDVNPDDILYNQETK